MRASALSLTTLLFTLIAAPAAAQLVENPPGATGGLFGGRRAINPNRTSQALEVDFDLSGGYDRDPAAISFDPTLTGARRGGWSAGAGSATARYRIGDARRSLEADARGDLTYQGNVRRTLTGGSSSLVGVNRFGRRRLNRLNVHLQTAYEPSFIFGAVNPIQVSEGLSTPLNLTPSLGVVEQRWLALSGTAGYQHYWSARYQTEVQAGAGRVSPVGDIGLNSEWQNAMVNQDVLISPSVALVGSYRVERSTQIVPTLPAQPIEYHTASAGARFSHRISSRRRVSLSLSAGATRLRSSDVLTSSQSAFPSFSAGVEFVALRSWDLSLRANRGVSALSGVSTTPMETDTVALSLNGSIRRRLRVSLLGSYLRGVAVSQGATTATTTTGTGGTMQVRYGLATWLAMFTTYSYYEHRIDGSLAPVGLPPIYNRQSLRAGVTLWLPLYGTF